MSGYHDGNDDVISHLVAKGLKPTRVIFSRRITFEESSVWRHSRVILDVGDERHRFLGRR